MELDLFSKQSKCNSHNLESITSGLTKKTKYTEINSQPAVNRSSIISNNKSFFAENPSDLNPFCPEIKPSDKFKKSSQKLQRNNNFLNFGSNDLPFLKGFQREKDSNDTWVLSNSTISNKLGDNSAKVADVIKKFNDSTLY